MRTVMLTIAVFCTLTVVGVTQQPPSASSTVRFEIASVKRSPPILDRMLQPFVGVPQPGVWRLRDLPIISALRNAYPGYPLSAQIAGAPDWLDSREWYDIEARTDPAASAEDVRQMVRTLLAERFKLALHSEKRQMVAAELLRRQDGKLGSGLTSPSVDCTAFRAGGQRPHDPARKANADRLACVATVMPIFDHTRLVPGADMRLTAGDVPISGILTLLGNYVQRPVVDRTGLTQRFDIELQFSADPLRQTTGDAGPSIRTAIAEQLGLQLRDFVTVGDILVIDRIERPTEN
jgi:uncharacterized protein (TIGR03435 family)